MATHVPVLRGQGDAAGERGRLRKATWRGDGFLMVRHRRRPRLSRPIRRGGTNRCWASTLEILVLRRCRRSSDSPRLCAAQLGARSALGRALQPVGAAQARTPSIGGRSGRGRPSFGWGRSNGAVRERPKKAKATLKKSAFPRYKDVPTATAEGRTAKPARRVGCEAANHQSRK
jgi:hypothetical protein